MLPGTRVALTGEVGFTSGIFKAVECYQTVHVTNKMNSHFSILTSLTLNDPLILKTKFGSQQPVLLNHDKLCPQQFVDEGIVLVISVLDKFIAIPVLLNHRFSLRPMLAERTY